MVKIAFVGCGFVADYYIRTLAGHPQLELAGVYDKDLSRARKFSSHHSVRCYASLNQLLSDPSVSIVVNLTNPQAHFTVSRACLEAGKHVYSEKPMALNFLDCQKLVNLAKKKKLQLSCAPCSILGESAQTMWSALRKNEIGNVLLAYAEMDDPIRRMNYKEWRSEIGAPWPYQDEFKIGCTLEHAGYCVTWLCAFFGNAKRVFSFSTFVNKSKTDIILGRLSPNFSVACIEFKSGVVARLTCSDVGPSNHRLLIIGDNGYLGTDDCWRYSSPVFIKKIVFDGQRTVFQKKERYTPSVGYKYIPKYADCPHEMDFSRGIAELADAIERNRPSILSSDFSLHVNEVMLAIHNSYKYKKNHQIRTTFEPISPTQKRLSPLS